MKRICLALCALAMSAPAFSQTYVRGYTRSDGTYVAPHYRSSPNSSTYDNYSTRGNVNPYTGQLGTRNPAPNYGLYGTPYGSTSNSSTSKSKPSYCAYSSYC